MIFRISVLLLLANATVAMAQPLYKWVEKDGSITFSPKQPPAGIEYETVNSSSAGAAASSNGIKAVASESVSTKPVAAVQQPLQQVEYAPGNGTDLPQAITRQSNTSNGVNTVPVQTGTGIAVSTRSSQASQVQATPEQSAAADYKRNRCQELRKRVVSLERRLKVQLTPEDMDNTVIHMARYQRSFDQHCVQ